MLKLLINALILLSVTVGTFGAQWTSSYVSNTNLILNQERGAYVMYTYYSSSFQSMGASLIAQYKTQYYTTLILMEMVLDNYRSSPLSTATINNINTELQLYRSCGIKAILRFVYTVNQGSSGNEGDATSASVVFNHITQMTPMLGRNQDVIAFVQAGFVGAWGEWYYTDSFGDQGQISTQNYADRKSVHEMLLAAVPQRTVQLRTPGFMTKFYGSAPITAPGSSNAQRTGTHNDCFLADASDAGTYSNYATQYPYLSLQTKYTPGMFETCAVSSRSACPTALTEIAGLHMVSGHRLYNTAVWNQWISGGCYNSIMLNLGHRFSFVNGAFDVQTAVGSSFSASVTIKNSGVAAPTNARKTEFILRKVDDGQICVATMPVDARTMQGGSTFVVSSRIRLPSNIPQGRWEILMHFADPFSSLYGVPWYKIQAANNGIYESGTGLHKMNAILDVLSGAVNTPVAGEVTAVCGLSTSSIVNSTVTSGDSSCLGGYYKSGGTCTMCPAGYACSSATASPVACSSGTWSSGGQRTCSACTSCSSKGTCQAKTGACLCGTGSSGFDCSLATSSTPVTASPNGPTTTPITAGPASTNAPVTSATSSPDIVTVAPIVSTTCAQATNLLSNPKLKASGTQVNGWSGGGTGYLAATGLNNQPAIQLYIPAGTVGGQKTVSQTVTFSTPTTSTIVFGAYVSSYLISGVVDWDYMLYITINYVDGTNVDYGVRAPVPTSDWTWLSSGFQPAQPVSSIVIVFLLQTHTGNAYITQPVVALAPLCAVTGGPVGITGGVVLASDSGTTGLSQSVLIGIYVAAAGVFAILVAAISVYCYRKRKTEQAVETAVAAQMTSV